MWWIVFGLVAVAAVYWKLIRPHKYWLEKGVKQGNPSFFVGESWGTVVRSQAFSEMVEMVYKMCPNTRYSGFYQFLTPTLVIKDPELIKLITVKEFDYFVDHQSFLSEDADPLWSKNLFALTGKKWRDMRTTLSPVFTSSKMKYMFSLISQSGNQFVNHLLKKNEDLITLEMKETFTRYTNDVIANTAFGIECNSLDDRTNEFYLMGKKATDFTGFWRNLKFAGYFLLPGLFKYFDMRFFPLEVANFFTQLVSSNISSREKHNIVRPDMIHLLMEARKHGLKHEESQPEDTSFAVVEESNIGKTQKNGKLELTDTDITSQALIFFFAGFDTVSALMCFMSYELGVNPDIQKRLIQEVDDTFKACGGKLTYEAVVGMKYMDMVVSETLRKWPSVITADRICTKEFTIKPETPEEKPVRIEKGTVLWIPVFPIHRDPEFYPEPERFDPERFSEENKHNVNPYTYLPFGSGPRNCIGSRFALLETKILFFYLLSHFEVVPVEKTQIPLVLCKKTFTLHSEGGFWLGLKRRSKI